MEAETSQNPLAALSQRNTTEDDSAVSSKGVPLIRTGVISTFLGVTPRGVSSRGLVNSTAVDLPSTQAVDLAVHFVRDALTGRNPNTRLAIAAGVAGAVSSSPGSVVEVIIRHWAYRGVLMLVCLVHCLLGFFEDTPPATLAPPFSWSIGAIEILCISVYCVDQSLVLWSLGWRHYTDKKWEGAFAVIAALSLLDWILYYPGGLRGMFRFSRPLRPVLGIAKRSSLRRLLSSVLWTIPALLDVSLLLGVAIFFFAVLGMQLFNRCVSALLLLDWNKGTEGHIS